MRRTMVLKFIPGFLLREVNIICLAAIIGSFVFFTGCIQQNNNKDQPKAIKGFLNLGEWDFEEDGPVVLSGEYEFYWKQQFTSENFNSEVLPKKSGFIDVPGSWNAYKINDEEISGSGYATYRLTLLLNNRFQQLAFKFLDMGTAYTVFVNGKRILSVGTPGKNAETTTPRYFPQVVSFIPDSSQLEIIFHISNFHHKRGGPWEDIQLGSVQQMHHVRHNRFFFDFTLFGSILIMGFYHLGLFILRRQEKPSFYFALLCFLVATRILVTDEIYLVQFFSEIDWEIFVKIEYFTFYLAIPIFARFIQLLFVQEFSKRVLQIILAVAALFAAIVLVTPVRVFSHTVQLCGFFALIGFFYGGYVIGLGIQRKREGAIILFAGYIVLFITVMNDILDVSEIVHTGHWGHVGVFIFILSVALVLSFRFSKMFKLVESQRKDLQVEIKERKRTEVELKKSREQLRELSARLNTALEEERALISREIHDELGQILSTLNMDITWLENHFPAKKELFQKTKSMSDLIGETIRKVQKISQNLRPSIIDNLGLYTAIDWHLKEFQEQSGIECRLDIQSKSILPGDAIAVSIFRIFQESLTNIARHAGATEVNVLIKENAGTLIMEIKDNGKGITEKEINDPKSFGLTGIRERIRLLNGRVDITGTHHRGTVVYVAIPINKKERTDAENSFSG